jgi:hypothetical protein
MRAIAVATPLPRACGNTKYPISTIFRSASKVVKRSAAEDVVRASIDGGEGQQPSSFRECRQLSEGAEERLAVERGQISRLSNLGVRERRQHRVDVVDGREPQNDVSRPEPLRWDG